MQYLPLVFLFAAVVIAGYVYLHQATRDASPPSKASQRDPATVSPRDT
jgi:hypothetical protein